MLNDEDKKWIREVYSHAETDDVWRRLWHAYREQTETLEQERLMAKGVISEFVKEHDSLEHKALNDEVVILRAELKEARNSLGIADAEVEQLRAVKSRIAELELDHATTLNAANARADEAESRFEDMREWCATKESEAAALRADVERLNKTCQDYTDAYLIDMGKLRADVERLEETRRKYIRMVDILESGLAEARALLVRWDEHTVDAPDGFVRLDTTAWLAANPEVKS